MACNQAIPFSCFGDQVISMTGGTVPPPRIPVCSNSDTSDGVYFSGGAIGMAKTLGCIPCPPGTTSKVHSLGACTPPDPDFLTQTLPSALSKEGTFAGDLATGNFGGALANISAQTLNLINGGSTAPPKNLNIPQPSPVACPFCLAIGGVIIAGAIALIVVLA